LRLGQSCLRCCHLHGLMHRRFRSGCNFVA
jgi:hypothetical protein